jgi:hypothetical protein
MPKKKQPRNDSLPGFLRLPVELRLQIFTYLPKTVIFAPTTPDATRKMRMPSLLLVCRQLYRDYLPYLVKQNPSPVVEIPVWSMSYGPQERMYSAVGPKTEKARLVRITGPSLFVQTLKHHDISRANLRGARRVEYEDLGPQEVRKVRTTVCLVAMEDADVSPIRDAGGFIGRALPACTTVEIVPRESSTDEGEILRSWHLWLQDTFDFSSSCEQIEEIVWRMERSVYEEIEQRELAPLEKPATEMQHVAARKWAQIWIETRVNACRFDILNWARQVNASRAAKNLERVGVLFVHPVYLEYGADLPETVHRFALSLDA